MLQQEIGLKSLIFEGFGTFGMRAIMVALDSLSNSSIRKNSLIACVISGAIIFQVSLKKNALNPSGLRALLLCMLKTESLISLLDKIASKKW